MSRDDINIIIRTYRGELNLPSYLCSEPYILGGQPTDDRIYVESRVERAPDYTEGEEQ